MRTMDKNAIWKWLLLAVLIAGSVGVVLQYGIRLGLDIKGGTSFSLEIDQDSITKGILEETPNLTPEGLEKAKERASADALKRALEIIRNRVDGLGIAEPVIYSEKGTRIVVQLPGIDEAKRKEAEEVLKQVAFLEFRLVHKNSDTLLRNLFDNNLAPRGYTLENEGERKCYVMDVKAVDPKDRDTAFIEQQKRFKAPIDAEFMLEKEVRDGRIFFTPHYVERKSQMTGSAISKAWKSMSPDTGAAMVELEFDKEGKKKFGLVTTRETKRQLGIVLDGTLYSAPVINEPITGGRAQISGGGMTFDDAGILATVLQAGSLPAPVRIVERRIVDPTLGAEAVRNGVMAGVVGCLAILFLMAIYYLLCGLVANVTLILNVILLPLGMVLVAGFLGILSPSARMGETIALPVLTLPGIAGIALMIGMAVDANVLIFERMREERRAGKGFTGVVQAGFDRAFSAIFDSNVTTIISAVILFVLGTGPVRGYAVTLTGGLIVSLFTAVIVSRMFFNLIGNWTDKTSIFKMMSVIKPTAIDFIRLWKPAITVSVVIIAVSWALMLYHGSQDASKVLAVDFTGGSSLKLSFKEKQSETRIYEVLSGVLTNKPAISHQREMETGREFLEIKVPDMASGTVAQNALTTQLASAGFKLESQDDVGAQVSKELKMNAAWAMGLALLAMTFYISIRFKFGFALGAVVAVFHDVLITAGITHLLGFQMSLTVLAALMTIVGYSINDTIVIFDRVRENLRLYRTKSFLEICNQSMNETLSRTLLTNFLTFISVLFIVAMGGEALRDFSVTMFIGMIAGTYSTMYIATPVMLLWYRFKRPDLRPV